MAALKSLGLSTNSIIALINSYSYQIDLQRQIKPGDKVTVITEKFITDEGEFSHHGKILYASTHVLVKGCWLLYGSTVSMALPPLINCGSTRVPMGLPV
jgi:hypothetical protein